MSEEIIYPWVTFRLLDQKFCISSEFIQIMKIENEIYEVPGGAAWLMGIVQQGGDMVPVMDMRVALGMNSTSQEMGGFGGMKQAHLDWVVELERTVNVGDPFTLADDPRMCAFGKWYYSYKPENYTVESIYKKIEQPHRELHECARECRQCEDPEKTRAILERAHALCEGQIVPLLDALEEAFRASTEGITLILELGGKKLGAHVDQVTAICPAREMTVISGEYGVSNSRFVRRALRNAQAEVFLEINIDTLMAL